MSSRLFGTDGLRGLANSYPMTADVCLALGRAVAIRCNQRAGKRTTRGRILIGRDTRLSGSLFEHALTAGILATGLDVELLGVIPTPGVAYLTRRLGADAGLVISASHNPHQDNGVKVFDNRGQKLPDEDEDAIEAMLGREAVSEETLCEPGMIGRVSSITGAIDLYTNHLESSFPDELSLEGLHLVVDCAHGATSSIGPGIFRRLGAELTVIGSEPDGVNINRGVGATKPDRCAELVKEVGADLGVAFDGDGDRLIMVDQKGSVVDGDEIMAICAVAMHREGRLTNDGIAVTVMSNIGLEVALRAHGISMYRTSVGDRYVAAEMSKRGLKLGGEQSGHIILSDLGTTGDGIASVLQVLAELRTSGRRLSELRSVMTRFPQLLVNVRVEEKIPLEQIEPVKEAIDAAEEELGETGRVLIRYSGTEPLVRVMVEGRTREQVEKWANRIASLIEEALGA